MNIEFNLLSIALAVGIIQGLFLTIILIARKKGNYKSNRFLALFIFAFTLLTLSDFLTETKLVVAFPHSFLLFEPIIFFLGPLAYFYVRSLSTAVLNFRKNDIFHFLIGFLFWLLLVPFYFSGERFKKNVILESYSNSENSIDFILLTASFHLLSYFIISIFLLKKYQVRIKDNYSYQEKINLNWLKIFLMITSVLWLFFTIQVFFHASLLKTINDILFTISMYMIGYIGLLQQPIIVEQFVQEESNSSSENINKTQKKYAHSTLTEKDSNRILSILEQLMLKEKYYLKSDLKLADLSGYSGIPMHHISQVINEKLNKNFFDYINEFRVEEFKQKIVDKEFNNYTILAIGLDSGFNSKASFNSAFKKYTGITPSDYKKKHLLQNKTV